MTTKKTSTTPLMTTIPYGRQQISDVDIQHVTKVFNSNFITQGPLIEQFESKIANICKSKYAVVFSSGTAALHASCTVAGLDAQSQAITSPISFAASANCILYCNAELQFADINANTAQIDWAQVEPHITNKTKAIIPVDLCGYPSDLADLYEQAQKRNIVVIRDAAHSFGAHYQHQEQSYPVGSCKHADMVCFSFHPVKTITTGEGGAVTTNSLKYAEKLRAFRHHGIVKDANKLEHPENKDLPWYYEVQSLGYNYRLTDIQCALGISQIDSLTDKISKRTKIASKYYQEFQGKVTLLAPDDINHQSAHHIFPILVSPNIRDDLMIDLRSKGILTQLHYIPIYRHPFYIKNHKFDPANFPNAETYFKTAISLPVYPDLLPCQQSHVIDSVLKFLDSNFSQ